jgi:Fe-S-cluster-containing hydrogenase component 2
VRCQHCADTPCIGACLTDAIKNKEIQLVINTPTGKIGRYDDSYIRKG